MTMKMASIWDFQLCSAKETQEGSADRRKRKKKKGPKNQPKASMNEFFRLFLLGWTRPPRAFWPTLSMGGGGSGGSGGSGGGHDSDKTMKAWR